MKKHTVTYWGEYAPPAYVSNGFIGFRIGKDPFRPVSGLLSGFTGMREGPGVEAYCIVPVPEISFSLDGQSAEPETIRQSYDFSCGELETETVLTAAGKTVTVTDTVFCSRTSPTLLLKELTFRADVPAKLKVRVSYRLPERWAKTVSKTDFFGPSGNDHDGKCLLHSSDDKTDAGVAFRLYGDFTDKECTEPMTAVFTVVAKPEPTSVQLITSYVPGVMHSEPHNQAHRMIKLATWNGFERLRELNRKAWAKLWESRITVEGAGEAWQDAIDASFFYLFSSASAFAPGSVAPFGLSNPDSYEGHCFWDTESFMFMAPLFCAPEIAESMLDYRLKRLPEAEANARLNGYRGIQFPWQSGATGSEVTVPFAGQAGGAGEQHVNLDVALAFDGFARVSGDDGFLREKAWPVLRGVAEWIVSRSEKTERGYEVLHVTGIDEESDNVPNDSYTNLMSRKLLRSAAEYSEKLGFGRREKWLAIADGMFIPSRPDGVMPQYEGMPEKEKQTSTTLMSYFPYGYSDDHDAETFRYYITHGMEDYLRYPMQSGYLGVFPAWLGDRKLALDFYEKANLTFFCEPFYACTEWSIADPADRKDPKRPLNTSFMTARGSLLSGLLMGLTKLCPWKGSADSGPEDWLGENIILPEGWTKVTLGKIYLHGKAYRAVAEQGASRTVLEEIDE